MYRPPACKCSCHTAFIPWQIKLEYIDLVDAASACTQCLNAHVDVLRPRHAWDKPAPEPSPYRDEPPPPAMFVSDEGPE